MSLVGYVCARALLVLLRREDSPSIDHLEGIDEEVEQLDLGGAQPTVLSPLGCGLLLKCIDGPHEGETFPVPTSRTIRIGRTVTGRHDIQLPRDEYTSEKYGALVYCHVLV